MRVPYKEIAFHSLTKSNKKTEVEANKLVNILTVDELETYVHAKEIVNCAIDSIARKLNLNEEDKKAFTDAIYKGPLNAPIFAKIMGILSTIKKKKRIILEKITDIHH